MTKMKLRFKKIFTTIVTGMAIIMFAVLAINFHKSIPYFICNYSNRSGFTVHSLEG